MIANVSQALSFKIWPRLLAVALLTAGQVVHADDKPAIPEGYKLVQLKEGGSVLVQKDTNPYQNVSRSGEGDKYEPDQPNMSATSSLANKQFSFTSGSTSKSDSALDPREQRAIITKPYDAGSHATPGQDAKFFTPASVAISPNTTDTNKSFTTSRADLGRNQAALLASTTSSDQGRTANLGTGNTSTFASPLNSKTFGGPEAEAVRRDLSKLNDGLMQIKDLPNRPLTIDEVRALINHGVKPNTDVAPEPPTKPLNDPNYKPEPSPAPPEPAPAPEEDKDDPVPSPGTMAQPPPENSEPLPQH